MRSIWYLLTPLALFLLALAAPAADKPARLDATGDPLPAGARARLGTLRFRTGAPIVTAALSPDGKLIAVAETDWSVRLLDAATGKHVRLLKILEAPVCSLTFSPDGKVLAVVEDAQHIQLWDTATGRAGHKLTAPQPQVTGVTFSADGKFLAACRETTVPKMTPTGSLLVWETASGKLVASPAVDPNQQMRAALSLDGKLLAVCGTLVPSPSETKNPDEVMRTIILWDVAKGREMSRLRADHGAFGNVAFAPDGKTLAATWGDSTLTLWDVATSKELRRCATRRGLGSFLAYSPDGKHLAAETDGGTVQLWDARTGKRLGHHEGPIDMVHPCFTADGKLLAWGSWEKAVFIWDVLASKPLTPAAGHTDVVQGLAFRAGGKELVSASPDGLICAWDVTSGKELRRKRVNPQAREALGGVVLSPDGRHLLAGGLREGRLCDAATGETLLSLEETNTNLLAGAFTPDGSRFAIAAASDPIGGLNLRVYEVATGQQLRELRKGTQTTAITLAPDGQLLVAVEKGGNAPTELHAWDLTTGKERWQAKLSSADVRALAFAPDGKVLASGGEAGAVTLWEGPTGRELRGLPTPKAEVVTAVQFSPDGRLLAAAYLLADKKPHVRVWEVASGTPRHEFTGHTGEVTALCFAPDGKALATGAADTTVLLWDLTGRTAEKTPKGTPTAEELDKLWAGLNDGDGRAGFKAMRRLQASPEEAVALLAKHVKPADDRGTDTDTIAKLIAALDADAFKERERATKALAALGKAAEQPLKKALAAGPSAEARRAIEGLLDKMKDKGGPPTELVRPLRAVEVLENLGTPEARKLLESLSKGQAEAPLTVAAKEALGRLARAARD
ncbi:MAG TPA: PQQ-binding-like beta-propeller repeat protein [Gemmataceae bacterium]|nr:PQQ-binding-like beta-propeller repeat protein [Gemmataceae bacterium]